MLPWMRRLFFPIRNCQCFFSRLFYCMRLRGATRIWIITREIINCVISIVESYARIVELSSALNFLCLLLVYGMFCESVEKFFSEIRRWICRWFTLFELIFRPKHSFSIFSTNFYYYNFECTFLHSANSLSSNSKMPRDDISRKRIVWFCLGKRCCDLLHGIYIGILKSVLGFVIVRRRNTGIVCILDVAQTSWYLIYGRDDSAECMWA